MGIAKVFEEVWLKRRSQFSTVAFLKTADPKRLTQFIAFIHAVYSTGREPFEVMVYKVWSGLQSVQQVEVGEEVKVVYAPVTAAPAPSPLAQAIGGGPVRDLVSALNHVDGLMRAGRKRYVLVLWGLFPYRSISDAEHYALVKFIRNAVFDDAYYSGWHFVVVFTENPQSIADEDTLRHCIVADVPPSLPEERVELLRKVAERHGVEVDGAELARLAEALRGLTLHEVESIALECIFKHGGYRLDALTAYKNEIVRKTGLLDAVEPRHGFEAVGGYEALKRFVRENIIEVLKNPERARRLGVEPPRGLLLFGPPGTGKTWFAEALAAEVGLPFLRLRSESILSRWYGETTRLFATALRIAEDAAPCIMFVDEVDRFGRRGGPTEHEESRRAFSVFLEWLGDSRRRTIVVATTNRVEDLDEAFLRVGRFDYIIPVLYPNERARLEILKVHTSVVRKVPLAADVDLASVAARTEMWSGAELAELVKRAARRALSEGSEEVCARHFEQALRTFKIDASARYAQVQRYMQLAERYANDTEFLEMVREEVRGRWEAAQF